MANQIVSTQTLGGPKALPVTFVDNGDGTYSMLVSTTNAAASTVAVSSLPGSVEANIAAIKADDDTIASNTTTIAGTVTGTKVRSSIVDALPAGANVIGHVIVDTVPAASDTADSLALGASATIGVGMTLTRTMSAASTNATSTKGSAGKLFSIVACNVNAAARYLKIYNKATAPTVGTDVPVMTIPLLTNQLVGFSTPVGFSLGTGIAWALTTGFADSDTGAVAANEISVALGWK